MKRCKHMWEARYQIPPDNYFMGVKCLDCSASISYGEMLELIDGGVVVSDDSPRETTEGGISFSLELKVTATKVSPK